MTYIVALQKPDFSAIISDLMVSFAKPTTGEIIRRDNTALKTGLLFKGCIFGLSGDSTLAIDFIKRFKEILVSKDSIEKNWQSLQEYIKKFSPIDNKSGFEIVLSCRVNGNPNLYLFNSRSRSLSLIKQEIHTLGSGKEILDEVLGKRRDMAEKVILEQMRQARIPILYFPYFYCLWLSELTMGFEYSLLEKIGVGGLFHFYYQTNKCEDRQKPAVYVLSVPDKKIKRYIIISIE